MYIKDGIVHAGTPPMVRVVEVAPFADSKLIVDFDNGEMREFDFSPLLDEPAFQPLKNKDVFYSVTVDRGLVVWEKEEIDISTDYLLDHGKPIERKNKIAL